MLPSPSLTSCRELHAVAKSNDCAGACASVAVFLPLLLTCTAVLSLPLLLLLAIVVKITTAIAAGWLLLCFYYFLVCCCCCCDHAEVPATALAAATFNACYAIMLMQLLFLVAFVLAIGIAIIIGWLLIFWIDFWVATLPLLFCRWCCYCYFADAWWCHYSCWHCHPFAACWTMVPLLLLRSVIVIASAAGWLLLLFVVCCCGCRCFFDNSAIAVVACDFSTAQLGCHHLFHAL